MSGSPSPIPISASAAALGLHGAAMTHFREILTAPPLTLSTTEIARIKADPNFQRGEFYANRIQDALHWIEKDPKVSEIIAAVLDPNAPKMRFEIVPSVPDVVRELTGAKFNGDCYLASVARKAQDGKVELLAHIVYFQESSLEVLPKAIIALQHEFYHIRRRSTGVAFQSDAMEEAETFKESIRGANHLIQRVREAKLNTHEAEQANKFEAFAVELETLVECDRQTQKVYSKRLKQPR